MIEIRPDPTTDKTNKELDALACLKKIPYTYNGENDVITFSRSAVFNQIFFVLAGNEDMHKRLDELGAFSQIPPLTTELAALERLKN